MVSCFMSRDPHLSLRISEVTSSAHAQRFNSATVGRLFYLLKRLKDKFHFTPNIIFNCNETGIMTVPNKPPRVVSAHGKKLVGSLSSVEHGAFG